MIVAAGKDQDADFPRLEERDGVLREPQRMAQRRSARRKGQPHDQAKSKYNGRFANNSSHDSLSSYAAVSATIRRSLARQGQQDISWLATGERPQPLAPNTQHLVEMGQAARGLLLGAALDGEHAAEVRVRAR